MDFAAPPPLDAPTGVSLPPGTVDLLKLFDPHIINAMEAIVVAIIVVLIWKFFDAWQQNNR